MMGIYEYGLGNFEQLLKDQKLAFKDLPEVESLIHSHLIARLKFLLGQCKKFTHSYQNFDFTSANSTTAPISGFTLEEKNRLYDILIDYGVPMIEESGDKGEMREQWSKLRDIIFKNRTVDQRTSIGQASLRERVEQTKTVERFVSQLHIVSQKIIKDYSKHINNIIQKWEDEDSSSSSHSESSTEKKKKRRGENKNDFSIDKERIKAAHQYEETHERMVFDPD